MIAEKQNWVLLDIKDSRYHIYGEEGVFNKKFVSAGEGRHEGVYNKEGSLLTEYNDPVNMGTYNYCGPIYSKIQHGLLDLATYYIWGNAKGCKAKKLPRSAKDFEDN